MALKVRAERWLKGLIVLLALCLLAWVGLGTFVLLAESWYPQRSFQFAMKPISPPPPSPVGQQAEDFALEDLAGETLRLIDTRSDVPVVIEFGSFT